MDETLARIKEVLDIPFHVGTRVVNCVLHSSRPLTERPRECDLCRTDLENQFALSLRANEFMNGKLDQLREIVTEV